MIGLNHEIIKHLNRNAEKLCLKQLMEKFSFHYKMVLLYSW